MVRIAIRLFINGFTIYVISLYKLIPGISVRSFEAAIITAVILGLVNVLIKPIVDFITFPIRLLTFGLVIFVINALMLMLVSYLYPAFQVVDFLAALWCSLAITVINILTDRTMKKNGRRV